MGRATDLLVEDWQPLTGAFEIADLVEFVPVIGIKHWMLGATPHSIRTS
jgi:hypothetical protein